MTSDINDLLARARRMRRKFNNAQDYEEFESYYIQLKLAGNKQKDMWIVADWFRLNYGRHKKRLKLVNDLVEQAHEDTPEQMAIAKQTQFEIQNYGRPLNIGIRVPRPIEKPHEVKPIRLEKNYGSNGMKRVISYAKNLNMKAWEQALVVEATIRANGRADKVAEILCVKYYTARSLMKKHLSK